MIGLAGLGALIFAESVRQRSEVYDVSRTIRSVAAAMFLAAGFARIAWWRLTGEATAALGGTALVVFGSLSLPRDIAAEFIYRTELAVELSPLTRLVSTSATTALLCLALRAPAVHAGIRPRIIIGAALTPSLSLYLAFACLHTFGHVYLDPTTGAAMLVELAMAAAWGAVAVCYLCRETGRQRFAHLWIAAWIGLMAAAGVARCLAVVDVRPWLICAALFQAGAAAIALGGATSGLFEVVAVAGNRLLSVTSMLHETEDYLSAEARRREEQAHDVRGAVAALRAATVTLERYGGRLEHDRRYELRSAIVSELGRLQHLVEADAGKPAEEFPLAQALAPVIAAERENGLVIEASLVPVRGYGRPADLATVVQHLLINARRYAPGSDVVIRSWQEGPDLCLSVEDRGPGVPVAEREAVFARGVRGTGSEATAGTGLGLYVARRLMTEQGSMIEIHDRPGGGARFVLRLPVAASERVPAVAGAARW